MIIVPAGMKHLILILIIVLGPFSLAAGLQFPLKMNSLKSFRLKFDLKDHKICSLRSVHRKMLLLITGKGYLCWFLCKETLNNASSRNFILEFQRYPFCLAPDWFTIIAITRLVFEAQSWTQCVWSRIWANSLQASLRLWLTVCTFRLVYWHY